MELQAKSIALVAGVAVAAVVVTAFVVVRQVPTVTAGSDPAAPLSATTSTGTPTSPPATPTATPSTTPSKTPTRTASSTPSSTGLTGPTVIELEPGSYERGAAPSIPYVDKRTLVDGRTRAKSDRLVWQSVRTTDGPLAVVATGTDSTELRAYDRDGKLLQRVPGVSTVKASADGRFSAYATTGPREEDKGAVVTWRSHDDSQTRQLRRPADYGLRILYVDAGFVYFSSSTSVAGDAALYRWKLPGSTVERRSGVQNPSAVSPQGSQVSMVTSTSDEGSCSKVVDAANTRIGYWSTCEFSIRAFSPRGRTVLAGAAYTDGYGEGFTAVLENSTGKVLRKWNGLVLGSAYEDEDHVLMVVEEKEHNAIVRCSIATGDCRLATPLAAGGQEARSAGLAYSLG